MLPDDEVFVLRAVDGPPVPFTRTREDGSTVTVLADTLVLGGTRFARTLVTRTRGAEGERTSSASLEGELRPTGDAVVLAAECDDMRFALWIPPDTIVESTGSELLVRSLLPPEGLKRFERP